MILKKRKEVYYGGRHFFTGTGPILILTTYDSLNDPKLIEKLVVKGIKKFMAYEVSEEKVKEKYGMQYKVIMGDLHQTGDLRVLDYDGHHVFYIFLLKNSESRSFMNPKTRQTFPGSTCHFFKPA